MGGYNNSSRSSQKIWDPTKTLGIINQDPGYQKITCVGYASTQGRRCRKDINKSNRQTITQTLEEISYLQPNDPLVITRLRRIAGLALCVRHHQDQASDILSQWRDELPRVQRIDSGTKKRTSGARMQSQTMKDLQEQLRKLTELMEEVENKLHEQQPETSSEEDSDEGTSAEDDSSKEDSSDCVSDDDSGYYFAATERQRRADKARKDRERLERERQDEERKKREARERSEAAKEQNRRRAQQKSKTAKEERDREGREEKKMREAEQAAESERERRRQAAQERADEAARARRENEETNKARKEQERQERERQEKEEAKRKCDAENAANNERIRQRARERAEKEAREKREKEEKEQAEWSKVWAEYQAKWATFKSSTARNVDLRDAIPWPVKSGMLKDVGCSNVKEFLDKSLPKGPGRVKLLRKECQKWHPDSVCRWPRAAEMTLGCDMSVDMICKVVTDMLNSSSARSSEFL
ncbi:hypothetical protein IFR04_004735 [Cadophora malorum]|uniref:Uncharacterized protein n=1 Tax=Cadophora malorum TaxID=108018 RepID=A0A8H8BSH9_9HELO|nr:hypothetical protein IFR04_004735 [Cadophora malorum]